MAGVNGIYHILQNEVCKWHVNSINISVCLCFLVLITAVVCSKAEQHALQWEMSWGTVTESEEIRQ